MFNINVTVLVSVIQIWEKIQVAGYTGLTGLNLGYKVRLL